MSEFNRNPTEIKSAEEYKSPSAEFYAAEERKYFAGNSGHAESNSPAAGAVGVKKAKKRADASALSHVLTSFAVVATAAVVAAAVISSGSAPAGKAQILNAAVSDTTVSYEVSVEEGEDLSVVLYNDFTRRSAALSVGENSGEFTGLKPGVSYTIAVTAPSAFGQKTVAEQSVTTDLLPPPAPVTEWRGLSYGCTCAVDGYFHFTMDFVDQNGYYSAFYASLTDKKGNVSYCEFTGDLHSTQSIGVTVGAELMGTEATFVLSYLSTAPGDVTGGAPREVKFVYDVKI